MRGNDASAATDFRDTYGVFGNAEELIRAHMAAMDPAVQKASLLPIDNEATAALDLDKLSKDAGGEVIAAAVRGNAIVCVVEEEGRTYKTVLPANESYKPPQAAGRHTIEEAAKADAEFRDSLAQLHAEHAQHLAEEKARLDQEMAEEMAKLKEEQQKAMQKAAEQDAKDAEEGAADDGRSTAVVQSNDPSQGGGAKTKKSTRSKSGSKSSK